MSFLSRLVSLDVSTVQNSSDSSSWSDMFRIGTSMTSVNAQKVATVLSCVNIKANALAVMPLRTYIQTQKGREAFYSNSLYEVLRYQANPNLTASLYKKMISQDIDLRGNHYSQIVRDGMGNIKALYPLVSDNMEVFASEKGAKTYRYNGKNVASSKILHIYDIPDANGLKGISRIEYAKESLEFAKSAGSYGNEVFKNATTPSGAFEMDGELSDEAYSRLKEDLHKKYSGLKNSGRPLLLEGGLSFKPLGLKNSDAEWLESRKFNREEVAAIFGVPVAMLNDSTNTAYGNLEQKYLEFYTGTIFPLTTIIEEQLRLSLLSKEQKRFTTIKFKYNAMLRVDAKTRAEYYQTRFNIGSITPNEIRAYEDERMFDGGDEHYLQMNLSTVKNLNKGDTNNG